MTDNPYKFRVDMFIYTPRALKEDKRYFSTLADAVRFLGQQLTPGIVRANMRTGLRTAYIVRIADDARVGQWNLDDRNLLEHDEG